MNRAIKSIPYVTRNGGSSYLYRRCIKGITFKVPLRTDVPRRIAQLSRGITSVLDAEKPSTSGKAKALVKAYLKAPMVTTNPERTTYPVSLKLSVGHAYLNGVSAAVLAKKHGIGTCRVYYWATQVTAGCFVLENAVAFSRNPLVLRRDS